MFMKFPKTCTIENKTSKDSFHSITYGTPVTVACNYNLKHEIEPDGSIILTFGWAVLPAGTTITHDTRITIDGYTPQIILLKNIENYRTGEIEGIKLELGKKRGT